MFRKLILCAAVAAFAPVARAAQTETPPELVVKLTVRPKAAPKPALRYLLLPELKEMTPGNPIPAYLKCVMERDLSGKESLGRTALRQADRAARMDKPDWQVLDKLKTDGIGLLLSDVQVLRELATGLQDRFRAEVAAGRIDEALETAKTMFSMARHLSEHPTLIGGLVGNAVGSLTIGPLEAMLEQPACPNLYWALTELPEPLVPMTRCLQGERVLSASLFNEFGLDDTRPMPADDVAKSLARFDKLQVADDQSKPGDSPKVRVSARVKDAALVRAARQRLADYGIPKDLLGRFPDGQVILLDEKREYEIRRDEVAKLMRLPYWQMDALAVAGEATREKALFDVLLPAISKFRRAEARLDQRVALLRHVEALRMYAAEHDGRLPDRMTDVGVPVPADPFSGKPFRYERHGDTAVLRGSPPRGGEKTPSNNVRYEITVRQ